MILNCIAPNTHAARKHVVEHIKQSNKTQVSEKLETCKNALSKLQDRKNSSAQNMLEDQN